MENDAVVMNKTGRIPVRLAGYQICTTGTKSLFKIGIQVRLYRGYTEIKAAFADTNIAQNI